MIEKQHGLVHCRRCRGFVLRPYRDNQIASPSAFSIGYEEV